MLKQKSGPRSTRPGGEDAKPGSPSFLYALCRTSSLHDLYLPLAQLEVLRKMAKVSQPELKRFLDKRIAVNIQGGRKIQGTLRGFDMFLNLVVDEAIEQVHPEAGNPNVWQDGDRCGTVVVRGNSVTSLEALENVKTR